MCAVLQIENIPMLTLAGVFTLDGNAAGAKIANPLAQRRGGIFANHRAFQLPQIKFEYRNNYLPKYADVWH
ncbi:MAG: hypothetical protein R2822_20445 [Spirosomataceae bacterium]